jgi:hypothetical protein
MEFAMWISFYAFACSKCSFQERVTLGEYCYWNNGFEIPVQLAPIWCEDCGKFSVGESLPNDETDRFLRTAYERIQAQITPLEQKPTGGFMGLVFGQSEKERSTLASLVSTRERIASCIAGENSRRKALAGRRVGARCLNCSGIRTSRIPIHDLQVSEIPMLVGLKHGGCGGVLSVARGATHFALKGPPAPRSPIKLLVSGEPITERGEREVVGSGLPQNVKSTIWDITYVFGPPSHPDLIADMNHHSKSIGVSVSEAWIGYIHALFEQASARAVGPVSDLDAIFTSAIDVSLRVRKPFLTFTFHDGEKVPAITFKPSDFESVTYLSHLDWDDPDLPNEIGALLKQFSHASWVRVLVAHR